MVLPARHLGEIFTGYDTSHSMICIIKRLPLKLKKQLRNAILLCRQENSFRIQQYKAADDILAKVERTAHGIGGGSEGICEPPGDGIEKAPGMEVGDDIETVLMGVGSDGIVGHP